MKRVVIFFALCLLALVPGFVIFSGRDAAAFDKDLLMDDFVFTDSGSMSATQIDVFLNDKSSCISTNSGFSAIEPTGYNQTDGFQYGGNVSAGTVIARSAQVYGLNPQVLLVTLQKEQSIITSTSCSTNTISKAMGYGCPDSGGSYDYSGINLYTRGGTTFTSVSGICVNSAVKAGFTQQVIRAAWLLKFSQERSLGNVGWAIIQGSWDNSDDLQMCYSGYMTQGTFKRCPDGPANYYDGWATIDSTATHMDSGATASLYRYTPHFHGNENFVSLFELWFGSTVSCRTPDIGATTLGVYDPAGGTFYERNCHTSGPASKTVQYGNANWLPLSGDWNRDGVFTPGAYDPNTGLFYLRNSNDSGAADITFQYGNIGWLPLSGDWNGNGYWSVGLYDPNTSTFYLKDYNGGGAADYTAQFGNNGWKPIVGDWDRNGSTTIGVYSPNTAIYYLNDQHDGSPAEKAMLYGNIGWTPLAGDWDGNGWWSIGAYNPNSATFYLRNMNDGGPADITTQYGNSGWTPVVGDWDGR